LSLIALFMLFMLFVVVTVRQLSSLSAAPATFSRADLGFQRSDAVLPLAVGDSSLPFVFFLHVPKTAGQTFSAHLHACFRANRNVAESEKAVAADDCTDVDDAECRQRRPASNVSNLSFGVRVDLNFAQVPSNVARVRTPGFLNQLYRTRRVGMGHCDTTVSDMLDSSRPVVFLTVLREPVSRFKSMYFYLTTKLFSRRRRQAEFVDFVDALNGLGADASSSHDDSVRSAPLQSTSDWWSQVAQTTFNWSTPVSLTEFASLVQNSHQDNYQTRALSGNLAFGFTEQSAPRTVDSQMLERAKATLRAMPFFGLTERFGASMALFRDTVGAALSTTNCTASAMQSRNKTPPFRARQSHAFDGAIRRMERFDAELYEFAQELFAFRCQENDACRDFEEDD
jgi:hypothetical protein